MDPCRAAFGHSHLSHCGFDHQQEKEMGADVLLQRTKEGEQLTIIQKNTLDVQRNRLVTRDYF